MLRNFVMQVAQQQAAKAAADAAKKIVVPEGA
jgi:hypothetical protein